MHAQSCAAASVVVAALGLTATAALADMPAAAKKIIDEFKLAPEAVAGWVEKQVIPAA